MSHLSRSAFSVGRTAILVFLGLSLALNGWLFVRLRSPAPAAPISPAPIAPSVASATDSSPMSYADAWASLDSREPAEMLANLRAARLPESVIRQIMWTRLLPLTPSRSSQLVDAPYWRREAASFEQRVRTQAGTRDPAYDAYVALFGTAPLESGNPRSAAVNAAMQGLSLDAHQQVRRIENDYFLRPYDGPTPATPESWARYAAESVRRLQTDLKAALTPAEFRSYQIRSQTVARQLSEGLVGLRLSQSEYDAVALLIATNPSLNLRGDGREQLQPQIAALLGPDRAAEFNQAVAGTAATNRVIARLGLPLTAAATIDSTRKEINQRAKQLKADTTLAPADRTAQLAALAAEARQRVTTAVVSPENYDAYYEYQGGWILEITGTPPPPPGS